MASILGLGESDLTTQLADTNRDTNDLSFLPSFYNDKTQCELKSQVISRALRKKENTLLCALGKSKCGFVNNDLRQKSWNTILNNQLILYSSPKEVNNTPHCDEKQIELDVRRSFGYVKDEVERNCLKKALKQAIVTFFRKYPTLRYYQGYHDVISVLVVVFCLDPKRNKISRNISGQRRKILYKCVEIFSLAYLRDFLMDSLDFPIDQISVIPLLIQDKDPQLFQRLQLDKQKPLYAIASVLTIFSHDMRPDINGANSIIFQIFDLLICTHSMYTPLVLYANIVLALRDRINEEYTANIGNFDNDVDLVHAVVQKVLMQSINDEAPQSRQLWETVLDRTRSDYSVDPKLEKKACKFINKTSPLRTTASGRPQLEINDGYSLDKLIKKGIVLNNKKKDKVPKDTDGQDWNYDRLIKTSLLVGAASLALGACHQHGSLLPDTMATSHLDLNRIASSVSLVSDSLKHIINSS